MAIPSRHKLFKTLTCFVLVASLFNLLSGYGAFTAFVLCVGQHGHVAVERAGHDHGDDWIYASENQTHAFHYSTTLSVPEKNAPPVHRDSFDTQSAGSYEPCLDIPIGQGDHARESLLENILQHLIMIDCSLFAVVLCLITVVQLLSLLSPRFFQTNPISSSSALRRSTVLLI